ncbi:MAG TPA: hypothetical protein VGT78_06185 [Rhizomicrobium sp.]|nr:hypothetical protein [Rhizomicrobium sp.]
MAFRSLIAKRGYERSQIIFREQFASPIWKIEGIAFDQFLQIAPTNTKPLCCFLHGIDRTAAVLIPMAVSLHRRTMLHETPACPPARKIDPSGAIIRNKADIFFLVFHRQTILRAWKKLTRLARLCGKGGRDRD